MRTQEELDILYAKFDKDVSTKNRGHRLALVIDQFFGVLIWNNSQDETISSKIGRKQIAGTSNGLEDKLCCLLSRMEHNHCNKSLGE